MVSKDKLFVILETWVVVDRRVQVEEQGQVERLVRVQQLILEAEALYFVEVNGGIFWGQLVDSNASYRFVTSVVYLVEREGSLAGVDHQLGGLRLEIPRNFIFCHSHELNLELSEHIDFAVLEAVVFGMAGHREPEGLADHVVEWHSEEVAAEEEQAEAVNAIELTPLSLLNECFVYLDSLAAFSDRQGQGFFFLGCKLVRMYLWHDVNIPVELVLLRLEKPFAFGPGGWLSFFGGSTCIVCLLAVFGGWEEEVLLALDLFLDLLLKPLLIGTTCASVL